MHPTYVLPQMGNQANRNYEVFSTEQEEDSTEVGQAHPFDEKPSASASKPRDPQAMSGTPDPYIN